MATPAQTIRRAASPGLFLAVAAAVYTTAFYVRGVIGTIDSPHVLAAAVVADLVVLVPAAYYVLVVRRMGWPAVSVAGVFVLSLIAATRIIPPEYGRVLAPVEIAAVLAEVAVLGFILWKVRTGVRRVRCAVSVGDDDALAAIREAARRVIDSRRAADAVAFEVGLLYYGLFSWRRRPPEGPNRYPGYQRTGYGSVLLGIGVMLAAELIAVHVLVQLYWSAVGAWVLSIVSAYGGLWLLAEWQAHRLRPTTVSGSMLQLRSGLRWDVDIPLGCIESLRRVSALEEKPRGTLDLVPFGDAQFELTTTSPVTARGIYGLCRKTSRIRFTVDDPSGFEEALLQ